MTERNEKTYPYIPSMPVPPGETILELLEERGIKQTELADRMGRPAKVINEIVKGKSAITADTAIQLEQVLGVPAKFWNNLEANYREILARSKAEEQYKDEVEIAIQYPYEEMARWDWIPKAKEPVEKTKHLLNYFGVTSLEHTIESKKAEAVLYRISKTKSYSVPAVTAWLRKGAIDAQSIETKPFDAKRLKELATDIRALTTENPDSFHPHLVEKLADAGIAFTVTPNLKNAPVNGASRWLSSSKALIQLSIRYRYNDIFWFSLFHELAHVLYHSKKEINIDMSNLAHEDEDERLADEFAANTLIPEKEYEEFIKRRSFEYLPVKSFAKSMGVHPGIVVGRLQHDDHIDPSNLNGLRDRFCWKMAGK